jgi:hypothetical protein
MPEVINIRVTLDSNVLISAVKENERYSKDCNGSSAQCERVGKTALKYRVYSADAFYLQSSLDFKTMLISLDEKDFIDRIKAKDADYNVYHAKDALSEILKYWKSGRKIKEQLMQE